MNLNPDDLTGEARDLFESWRRAYAGFGHGDDAAERLALDEVARSGLVERGSFDQLTAEFERMGLSEAAAERAAAGRDFGTVSEARAAFDEADRQRRSKRSTPKPGRSASAPKRKRSTPSRTATFVESGTVVDGDPRVDQARRQVRQLRPDLGGRLLESVARRCAVLCESTALTFEEAVDVAVAEAHRGD